MPESHFVAISGNGISADIGTGFSFRTIIQGNVIGTDPQGSESIKNLRNGGHGVTVSERSVSIGFVRGIGYFTSMGRPTQMRNPARESE